LLLTASAIAINPNLSYQKYLTNRPDLEWYCACPSFFLLNENLSLSKSSSSKSASSSSRIIAFVVKVVEVVVVVKVVSNVVPVVRKRVVVDALFLSQEGRKKYDTQKPEIDCLGFKYLFI